MAIHEFDYYLHDDYSSDERLSIINNQTGLNIDIDDELAQKMGKPFYEVVIHCTLDDETGVVQIVGVN